MGVHCGATEPLVVDHRTPHDRYPGSFFDMTNLWTLLLGRQQLQAGPDGRGVEGRARTSRTGAGPDRWAADPGHLQHRRAAPMIDPAGRHAWCHATSAPGAPRGRAGRRQGPRPATASSRDLFGRFESLDLALDEAAAEYGAEERAQRN